MSDWRRSQDDIFVRIDPGEAVVDTLIKAAEALHLQTASIVSGVGMLDQVQFGFFDVRQNDYVRTTLDGVHDVSVVTGNVARSAEGLVPHVHIVLNTPDQSTLSGHLIEARTHITMELFLRCTALSIERTRVEGRPATRLEVTND